MTRYMSQMFAVLVLVSCVKTQNYFGFNDGEVFNGWIDSLSSIDLMFDIYTPEDQDDGLTKLTEAVEEIKHRLEELLTMKEKLKNECDQVIGSVQAQASQAKSDVKVDTSKLLPTSDLHSADNGLSQLEVMTEDILSNENDFYSGIPKDLIHLRNLTKSTDIKLGYATKAVHDRLSAVKEEKEVTIVCPAGFTKIESHCYGKAPMVATLPQGYAFCVSLGAYIVQTETQVERTEVAKFLKRNGDRIVFSGLTDVITEGKYVWSWGGQPLNKKAFTNVWSPDQPDNWYNKEHSVDMVSWQGYSFNDLTWDQMYDIACEIGDI